MPNIRILLVDDHKLFRAGIRSLLQTVSGVEVVAEAGDGREALRLIETHRPDVVLLDRPFETDRWLCISCVGPTSIRMPLSRLGSV